MTSFAFALLSAIDAAFAGEEFCHICGRCTDHRGEHSDEQLVAFATGKMMWFFR